MSVWIVLLFVFGLALTSIIFLVIWASIDVRKRFRAIDAEAALSPEEQKVVGCEGDCNICPLQDIHVGLRTRIRMAETLSASVSRYPYNSVGSKPDGVRSAKL